jgi:LCP family protein required for cell wall assembly
MMGALRNEGAMSRPVGQPATSRWRRIFTVSNVGSVTLGVIVFLVTVNWWNTHLGAVAAGAVSALVTGLSWYLWWRATRPESIGSALDAPHLGTIPSIEGSPAPTLTAPDSPGAHAFGQAVSRIDSETHGQVLLVSSPAPGHGASTVALNLAISATRAGRRVVLVDGDIAKGGLSQYGRNGAGTGLLDLAAGDSDLAAASRLWTLDEHHRLPFIPRGTARPDPDRVLASGALADAVHDLTEHADLLLVDVAPVAWNDAAAPLATHADGTVLVVAGEAGEPAVAAAAERLAAVGAPVVGYVVNRAGHGAESPHHPVTRLLKRALATFVITLTVYLAWNGFLIWNSWRTAERHQLDVVAAAALLPLPSEGVQQPADVGDDIAAIVSGSPTPPDTFTSFMVVGSDLGGARADVIILAMLPAGDDPPVMVSLPRDLYLPNRCTQSYTRINANLNGCGDDVNGPSLLALAVEDFTGVEIDHFALFDFDGFERIVDEVGGVEICVPNAVRDDKAELSLPAGCTNATGAQALAWVRSRRTQELVDGRWRTMSGVNDLTRNARQQELILQMLSKLRSFASPSDLTNKVRSLTQFFTFDNRLGLAAAINIAWDLRDLDLDTIERLEIPVTEHETPDGAQVLVPTVSFDEVLDQVYADRPDGPA